MRFASLILAVANFGGFIWAFQRFFKRSNQVETIPLLLVKYVGLLAMVGYTVALVYPRGVSFVSEIFADLLLLLSLAIFFWAIQVHKTNPPDLAFSGSGPKGFVSHGPYRYVRHPFYLSYSLCWLGSTIASGRSPLLLFAMILGLLYWKAAASEEKQFSTSSLSKEYEAYCKTTGRFFPKFATKRKIA